MTGAALDPRPRVMTPKGEASVIDDRWRDTYDAWKLATPPEYEEEPDEASVIEEDAWRAGYHITRADAEAIVEERRRRELGLPPGEIYGPFDPRPKPVEPDDEVPF